MLSNCIILREWLQRQSMHNNIHATIAWGGCTSARRGCSVECGGVMVRGAHQRRKKHAICCKYPSSSFFIPMVNSLSWTINKNSCKSGSGRRYYNQPSHSSTTVIVQSAILDSEDNAALGGPKYALISVIFISLYQYSTIKIVVVVDIQQGTDQGYYTVHRVLE